MDVPQFTAIALHLVVAPLTALHALLYKRDPRSALGWITVCLLFPLAGPLSYYLFGVNRVRTRARKLHGRPPPRLRVPFERGEESNDVEGSAQDMPEPFRELARVSDSVTRRRVLPGNEVTVLHNGEQAYPPMLEAIRNARERVYLITYIFETNRTGHDFADALSDAKERGVDVKVIVDGMGELYSLPRAVTFLRRRGLEADEISAAAPDSAFAVHKPAEPSQDTCRGRRNRVHRGDEHRGPSLSQRETGHRDPRHAFHAARADRPAAARMCFSIAGSSAGNVHCRGQPAVTRPAGNTLCRAVVDGPDEDMDKLVSILMGAISAARRRILIVTPYFLPSREMIGALQAASARGVDVRIVLPGRATYRSSIGPPGIFSGSC